MHCWTSNHCKSCEFCCPDIPYILFFYFPRLCLCSDPYYFLWTCPTSSMLLLFLVLSLPSLSMNGCSSNHSTKHSDPVILFSSLPHYIQPIKYEYTSLEMTSYINWSTLTLPALFSVTLSFPHITNSLCTSKIKLYRNRNIPCILYLCWKIGFPLFRNSFFPLVNLAYWFYKTQPKHYLNEKWQSFPHPCSKPVNNSLLRKPWLLCAWVFCCNENPLVLLY